MAVDLALAESVQRAKSHPVLRLYTWSQPAISCGHFQRIEQELDLQACRQKGVAVVRRPTGGRAVRHGSDLTLTIVAHEAEPGIGDSVEETYRRIAGAVTWGLRDLGIQAELVRTQATGKEILGSASCFASKSRHELVLGGRKAFGCAQRRRDGVILCQGSLQLWGDGDIPAEWLKRPEGGPVGDSKGIPASLQIPLDAVKEAIAGGFRKVLAADLEPSRLTDQELEKAQSLLGPLAPPSEAAFSRLSP